MKKHLLFLALGVFGGVVPSFAGEAAANGCRAVWTEQTLEVGNGLFTRRYEARGGVLRTLSLVRTDGTTWPGRPSAGGVAADALVVVAEPAK